MLKNIKLCHLPRARPVNYTNGRFDPPATYPKKHKFQQADPSVMTRMRDPYLESIRSDENPAFNHGTGDESASRTQLVE